jgi:hypothetical protein
MDQSQISYFTSQLLLQVQNSICLFRIILIWFIRNTQIDVVIGLFIYLFIVCLFKDILCGSGHRPSKVERQFSNDLEESLWSNLKKMSLQTLWCKEFCSGLDACMARGLQLVRIGPNRGHCSHLTICPTMVLKLPSRRRRISFKSL